MRILITIVLIILLPATTYPAPIPAPRPRVDHSLWVGKWKDGDHTLILNDGGYSCCRYGGGAPVWVGYWMPLSSSRVILREILLADTEEVRVRCLTIHPGRELKPVSVRAK